MTEAPPHPFSSIRIFVFKQRTQAAGWGFHSYYLHEVNAKVSAKALLMQGWEVRVGELDVMDR